MKRNDLWLNVKGNYKEWAIPEKIDEFDPVFFPLKNRKGVVL